MSHEFRDNAVTPPAAITPATAYATAVFAVVRDSEILGVPAGSQLVVSPDNPNGPVIACSFLTMAHFKLAIDAGDITVTQSDPGMDLPHPSPRVPGRDRRRPWRPRLEK